MCEVVGDPNAALFATQVTEVRLSSHATNSYVAVCDLAHTMTRRSRAFLETVRIYVRAARGWEKHSDLPSKALASTYSSFDEKVDRNFHV